MCECVFNPRAYFPLHRHCADQTFIATFWSSPRSALKLMATGWLNIKLRSISDQTPAIGHLSRLPGCARCMNPHSARDVPATIRVCPLHEPTQCQLCVWENADPCHRTSSTWHGEALRVYTHCITPVHRWGEGLTERKKIHEKKLRFWKFGVCVTADVSDC